MPGYLDTYGVGEERRGRWIKRILFGGLAIAVVGTCAYLYFRTWSQEQTVKHFFAALENRDLQGAYKMWCPPENPCRYNPYDKFEQDWGPTTPYVHGAAAKVDNIDYCGEGVVFNISYPNAEPVVLWVERGTNIISFAPSDWERCPGRHWQFRRFFKSLFSS
ncbi:MAG: hypothetical protein JWO19_5215 [Bryobacterales bacterium]|nr:hypothetical protein [Bryobacterales bacterium]